MIKQLLALLMLAASLGQGGVHTLVDQTNLGGTLYLVNRTYQLTQDYRPDDLVMPNVKRTSSEVLLRPEAASALESLFNAAKVEGHTLVAISGFRSYQTQRAIYQRKVSATGSKQRAQLLVAPAGTSEHQLGLAIDIGRKASTNLNASFGRSPEGQWVAANAHEFGFIVRYKAEWTEITGYADEPWHLRFVGVDHARAIVNRNEPLETYIQSLANPLLQEVLARANN
ncbi:MAG: M15 family metallopeptidase [Clostridiales bacterium]|jgi:D-alanyl-D-alanine carboxypeptidase|nr:M15 family metallopeptidase [Clostridiales bacterium]